MCCPGHTRAVRPWIGSARGSGRRGRRRVTTQAHCELQEAFIDYIEHKDDQVVTPMPRSVKEFFIRACHPSRNEPSWSDRSQPAMPAHGQRSNGTTWSTALLIDLQDL